MIIIVVLMYTDEEPNYSSESPNKPLLLVLLLFIIDDLTHPEPLTPITVNVDPHRSIKYRVVSYYFPAEKTSNSIPR